LRDVLYDTGHAYLNINDLHDNCRKLGEGIRFIADCLLEARKFSKALAQGNLNAKLPAWENEIASSLKALHASLRHITWQTQQVAKGDYQQRVDFMGEFSTAFNAMIEQLDQRQKSLEAEVEIGRKKTLALEQSNSLFEVVTTETSLWIFVLCTETKTPLFINKAAESALTADSEIAASLKTWLEKVRNSGLLHPCEINLNTREGELFYSVQSYPIQMKQEDAIAYVLRDITHEKQETQKLEVAANIDALTRLYNRYFGMNCLHNWLSEGRAFSLCFVDIDYLKYVNDNFGHKEGDYYIVSVADAIKACFKDGIVSRLGGDEIMVLIENMNAEDVEKRFFLLREELYENSPSEEKCSYRFSISYGIVEVEQHCLLSASDLLGLADERMYHFKRAHKAQRGLGIR
jgi:diguanylate cyclase (GGDEF)-like protein